MLQVGKISAGMFSIVGEFAGIKRIGSKLNVPRVVSAMAVMAYALYTYHWRAASIRRGGRGPYDDRLGPVRYLGLLYLLWR